MEIITILLIALGLSMDAFAVSIASGAGYKDLHIKHMFRIALFFGGFQAIMPLIGYIAGESFSKYISSYDHWVSFAILAFVGVKMIYESFQIEKAAKNPAELDTLLVLAVATSIDALAVGFTLSLLDLPVMLNVAIIGIITFVLSMVGVQIGKKMGHIFENKIEMAGGLILIGIGLKILLQHILA